MNVGKFWIVLCSALFIACGSDIPQSEEELNEYRMIADFVRKGKVEASLHQISFSGGMEYSIVTKSDTSAVINYVATVNVTTDSAAHESKAILSRLGFDADMILSAVEFMGTNNISSLTYVEAGNAVVFSFDKLETRLVVSSDPSTFFEQWEHTSLNALLNHEASDEEWAEKIADDVILYDDQIWTF